MEKIWIQLTRAIGKFKNGEIVEVDEGIGRAYIEAGAAKEHVRAQEVVDQAGEAGGDEALLGSIRSMVQAEVRTALAGVTRTIGEAARTTIGLSVTESEDDKKLPTGGFRSMGHFAHVLVRGMDPTSPDPTCATQLREWQGLATRAITGMNTASDPEGGLLIPAEFSAQLWDKSREYENLANRVGLTPIGGNSLTINGNAETSRANGSRFGGVQSYWTGEGQQYTASRPTFHQVNLKLHKLTVLVYATNELLEDSGGAAEGYINRVAPQEIAFKMNDGLTNGTGAGNLVGYLNAACKITVAAVPGQGAGTIVAENITAMWARFYGPSRRNAVWLINQDAEAQLDGLKFATGSSSGQLVWMPPTGLSGNSYSTIKGRPVITTEQASTLGTEGDISLVDFSQYVGITKAGGVRSDMSIHLRFDYDETVFKFSLRADAQPMWKGPLTPYKGTTTQSPIVTLNSTRT